MLFPVEGFTLHRHCERSEATQGDATFGDRALPLDHFAPLAMTVQDHRPSDPTGNRTNRASSAAHLKHRGKMIANPCGDPG